MVTPPTGDLAAVGVHEPVLRGRERDRMRAARLLRCRVRARAAFEPAVELRVARSARVREDVLATSRPGEPWKHGGLRGGVGGDALLRVLQLAVSVRVLNACGIARWRGLGQREGAKRGRGATDTGS